MDYLHRSNSILSSAKARLDRYVFRQSLKKLKKYVHKPKRYLEFGPGRGDKFDILEGFFGSFENVTFIDIDTRVLDYLRRRYHDRNISYLNLSADAPLPHLGDYDLVVSSHVIEHLTNPRKHLYNINAVLRDGGAAFIASPNLTSRDAKRLGTRWRGYEDPTHISLLGIDQLRLMCELEGLSIQLSGSSLGNPPISGGSEK